MAKNGQEYNGFTTYSEKSLLQKIWSFGIGRFFLLVLAFIIVILIDVLLSWNNARTFLIIMGLELLIAFVGGWIYFFISQKH
jgi:high-affinity Fe2+/Pb2+ permease